MTEEKKTEPKTEEVQETKVEPIHPSEQREVKRKAFWTPASK
jgi:hypothetical protein